MPSTPPSPESTSLWTIIFGGSGFAVAVWKTLDKWITKWQSTHATRAITDMALVYDGMQDVMQTLGSDRCLLAYSSNGGGIPSAGNEAKCSILYEVKDRTLDSVRQNWQNVPLDQGYIKMLSQVVVNGSWHGTPEQLEPGFLRDMYETEEVGYAYIHEIAKTKKKFYYLAIRWSKDAKVPTSFEIEHAVQVFKNTHSKLLQ